MLVSLERFPKVDYVLNVGLRFIYDAIRKPPQQRLPSALIYFPAAINLIAWQVETTT